MESRWRRDQVISECRERQRFESTDEVVLASVLLLERPVRRITNSEKGIWVSKTEETGRERGWQLEIVWRIGACQFQGKYWPKEEYEGYDFWTLREDNKGAKKNFGYGRAGKQAELWLKRLKERLPEQCRVEEGTSRFWGQDISHLERGRRVLWWVLDAKPNVAVESRVVKVVDYPFWNIIIPGNWDIASKGPSSVSRSWILSIFQPQDVIKFSTVKGIARDFIDWNGINTQPGLFR